MEERNLTLEIITALAMVIATAFVATFVVSLINTVCR